MTTRELLEIVKSRGMEIYIKDGNPLLRRNGNPATEKLMAVLKRHRERIIEMVKDKTEK